MRPFEPREIRPRPTGRGVETFVAFCARGHDRITFTGKEGAAALKRHLAEHPKRGPHSFGRMVRAGFDPCKPYPAVPPRLPEATLRKHLAEYARDGYLLDYTVATSEETDAS